ncbi:hypothetical protein FNF29_07321 [Cafeteria roenbergensis]|uniref:DAGKc domain-containing protein n=1 Tax=Cafeteria roenbergensis TaxID=33653 RepID=A0A5A8C3V8_CAFRO|nr:hypothetical protein FNF29_07321 [Cafeteria roenbergensis]|eukprot:KAA0147475.1 hypothetical protein FNF29_07321 [Cafeteria roenbergensis]
MDFGAEDYATLRTLVLFDSGNVADERASPGKLLFEKVAFKDTATWYPLTADGLASCMDECRSIVEWALAGDGLGGLATAKASQKPSKKPAAVVVVASGDAAASVVMTRLVREGFQPRVAVLPLPCGQGNRMAMTAGFGTSLPQVVLTGTNADAQRWWDSTVGAAVDRLTGNTAHAAVASGACVPVDTWAVRVRAVTPKSPGSHSAGPPASGGSSSASRSSPTRPPRRAARIWRVMGSSEREAPADVVTCSAICGLSMGVWAQAEYERRSGTAAAAGEEGHPAPSTEAVNCGLATQSGRLRCDWGPSNAFDRVKHLAGTVVGEAAPPVSRLLRRLVVDGKLLAEGACLPACQALILPNVPAWSQGTDLWRIASPSAIAWASMPESEAEVAERSHNPFGASAPAAATLAAGASGSVAAQAPATAGAAERHSAWSRPASRPVAARAPAPAAGSTNDDDDGPNPFAADGEDEFYGSKSGSATASSTARVSTSGLYPPGYGPGGKLPPAPAPAPAPATASSPAAAVPESAADDDPATPSQAPAPSGRRTTHGPLPSDSRASEAAGSVLAPMAGVLDSAAAAVGAGPGAASALVGLGHSAAAASADVVVAAEAELRASADASVESGVGLPAAGDGQIDILGVASLLQLGLACSTGTGLAGGLHRIGRARSLRFELLPARGKGAGAVDPAEPSFAPGRCVYIQCDAECVKAALPAIVEVQRGQSVNVVLATPQARLGQAREEEWW